MNSDPHSPRPISADIGQPPPATTTGNLRQGLLSQYDQITSIDANDRRLLKVLQYKHDHILSRHFETKTQTMATLVRERICGGPQPPGTTLQTFWQILHNLHRIRKSPHHTTLRTIASRLPIPERPRVELPFPSTLIDDSASWASLYPSRRRPTTA